MKYLKFVTTFSLILLLFTSMRFNDWKTWKSDDGKMSIEYPSTWNFNPNFPNVVFSIKTERDGDSDFFREFLTLIKQKVDKTIKLKDFAQKFNANSGFDGTNVLSEKNIKIGKYKAYEIISSAKQSFMELKFKHVIFFQKEQAYILSYSAETANYDKYLKDVDRMISSFKTE